MEFRPNLLACVSWPQGEEYTVQKVIKTLSDHITDIKFTKSPEEDYDIIWGSYELINFDAIFEKAQLENSSENNMSKVNLRKDAITLRHKHLPLLCSYDVRKGLIRKHFLCKILQYYIAKHPHSILAASVPESWSLEVDYAEFLDDALDCEPDLRFELDQNSLKPLIDRKFYILKPSMADEGRGIRIFQTQSELQEIFDGFESTNKRESKEDGSDTVSFDYNTDESSAIQCHNLRHFIVQEYIHKPLLINGCKFHIRAYVLTAARIKVCVFREMLALLSTKQYCTQYNCPIVKENDLVAHLTNSKLQKGYGEENSYVKGFWNMHLPAADKIFDSIQLIVSETFRAVCSQKRYFHPLPNAFEIYGFDFLVDNFSHVWFLEANCYPSFSKTGDELSWIIESLFSSVAEAVILPYLEGKSIIDWKTGTEKYGLYKCLDVDLTEDRL